MKTVEGKKKNIIFDKIKKISTHAKIQQFIEIIQNNPKTTAFFASIYELAAIILQHSLKETIEFGTYKKSNSTCSN